MKKNLGILALFFVVTFLYLYPASVDLFEGSTTSMLGDDSDPAPVAYSYENLLETWKNHPSRFFYGAVFHEGRNLAGGVAGWYPHSERWLILLLSNVFPLEQLYTAMVFVILMLNGLAMYALMRAWNSRESFAIAAGLAWAFCAFTRARAKVHGSMAGTYHIPLIFLGLTVLIRGKSWRSVAAAAALFLLASTTVHYFLVVAAALTPFFLVYYYMHEEIRENLAMASLRLLIAALPSVGLLGFNAAFPIPSDVAMKQESAYPPSGKTPDGRVHPFLQMFAAHPLDYISGDIGFGVARDLNPLRYLINDAVITQTTSQLYHERANGIRWVFWILALVGLYLFWKDRIDLDREDRNKIYFFIALSMTTAWLAASPDFPFTEAGASYWLYSLVSQIRVPNRSAIYVHFSLIAISAIFLNALLQRKKTPKWLAWPLLFPALVVFELPPLLSDLPTSPVRPRFSDLQRDKGACGLGVYYPYVGQFYGTVFSYQIAQRLRGTNCTLINLSSDQVMEQKLVNLFAYRKEIFQVIAQGSPGPAQDLERFAKCVPLSFVIFDPNLPPPWVQSMCQKLGWQMLQDGVCMSPERNQPMLRTPSECG